VALAAARVRAGSWRLLPAAPVTKPLGDVVSVWTGHEMIIHGIRFTAGGPRGVTFAYRPATRTWVTLARGPRPPGLEADDIAVWTGSEMLVLGLTSGAYNPATNTWRPIARDGPDESAVVGWTGHEAIVWGGVCCDDRSHDGQAYNPATDTWTKLPTAPLQVRRGAMGAWTGKELVVAGGVVPVSGSRFRHFRDAAAYDPATRTWRRLAPMPRARAFGTAVWDGKEILFLGGNGSGPGALAAARGMAYNPATNRWRRLPAMKFRRSGFAAVRAGRQVLVWGGLTGHFPTWVPPPNGEAYNPATNTWTSLPKAPLRGRASPTAVWTGHQMIIWGGSIPRELRTRSFIDGAAYTPRKP
jgi:N-acetylneuraminic acid mutarotase